MGIRHHSQRPGIAKRPLSTAALALTLAGGAAAGIGRAPTVLEQTPIHVPPLAQDRYTAPSLDASGSAEGSWAPATTWDLSNLDHERVDHWVEVFTTSKRDEFERYLERMGRYGSMVATKLEERGMPQDLIYLALIESGFNPTAYSSAQASGLWQFIEETGERYGLDVNRAVDERNDPVKATDAALDYLQELYDRLGSWYLAAAAYNTGENRVARIMREETGSEKGPDEAYYRIWDRLPRETRDYVPLMVAAARIVKEPAKYGFTDVEMEAPLAYDEFEADPATPLTRIARLTGTSVQEIRELNPQLKLDRTRNDEPSTVRVPTEQGAGSAAGAE